MSKFFSVIIRQLIKSISILEAIIATFHLSPATVKWSNRMEETAALLGIHTLEACGCKLRTVSKKESLSDDTMHRALGARLTQGLPSLNLHGNG